MPMGCHDGNSPQGDCIQIGWRNRVGGRKTTMGDSGFSLNEEWLLHHSGVGLRDSLA